MPRIAAQSRERLRMASSVDQIQRRHRGGRDRRRASGRARHEGEAKASSHTATVRRSRWWPWQRRLRAAPIAARRRGETRSRSALSSPLTSAYSSAVVFARRRSRTRDRYRSVVKSVPGPTPSKHIDRDVTASQERCAAAALELRQCQPGGARHRIERDGAHQLVRWCGDVHVA